MEENYNNGVTSIDQDYVRTSAESITNEDLKRVVERTVEIGNKFRRGGPLHKYWEDAKLLLDFARDYFNGTYRKTPWWVISSVAFALLYVLNPFDLIPDFLPIIGQVDDAAILGVSLMMLEKDLEKYKLWKLSHIEM